MSQQYLSSSEFSTFSVTFGHCFVGRCKPRPSHRVLRTASGWGRNSALSFFCIFSVLCPATCTQPAVGLCRLGCHSSLHSLSTTTTCHVSLEQLLSVQQTTETSLCLPAQETALLWNDEDGHHKDCSTAVLLVFLENQRSTGLTELPLLSQAPLAPADGQGF